MQAIVGLALLAAWLLSASAASTPTASSASRRRRRHRHHIPSPPSPPPPLLLLLWSTTTSASILRKPGGGVLSGWAWCVSRGLSSCPAADDTLGNRDRTLHVFEKKQIWVGYFDFFQIRLLRDDSSCPQAATRPAATPSLPLQCTNLLVQQLIVCPRVQRGTIPLCRRCLSSGSSSSPFSEKNAYMVGSFIVTKSQHGRPMHCCTTGVHPWVVGSE